MRPTARRQSALRMPFNSILGTEANVRVLRVLAERHTSLSAAEIARQAQLQPSTVHRTLKSLEERGIIAFVGTTTPQVTLRERGPLAKAIRQLFAAERARADALTEHVRRVVNKVTPPPRSAWLSRESVESSEPGMPIELYLVDSAERVDVVAGVISADVEALEKKLDIPIEVHGLTAADLEAMPRTQLDILQDAVMIVGVPPQALVTRTVARHVRNIRSHRDHDARARAVAAKIAEAIATDPSVIEDARADVEERWKKASPGERKELEEWRRILRTSSPARLRKFLVDPGERATRLRQTMPFLRVFAKR